MGCSKTAQALITKFNYEERGMKVLLLKPSVDVRDGEEIVKSRIGLTAKAVVVNDKEDLYKAYEEKYRDRDVIIVDECQFLTPEQVDELGQIVIDFNVPVLWDQYPHIVGWETIPAWPHPTQFIPGGNSPYVTDAYRDALLAQFPQARAHVIAGAGHWVHAEKPEAVLRAIRRYLTSIAA